MTSVDRMALTSHKGCTKAYYSWFLVFSGSHTDMRFSFLLLFLYHYNVRSMGICGYSKFSSEGKGKDFCATPILLYFPAF